jgi:hypothetical protein
VVDYDMLAYRKRNLSGEMRKICPSTTRSLTLSFRILECATCPISRVRYRKRGASFVEGVALP